MRLVKALLGDGGAAGILWRTNCPRQVCSLGHWSREMLSGIKSHLRQAG